MESDYLSSATDHLVRTRIKLTRKSTGSSIVLDQDFLFNYAINVGRNADWRHLGQVVTAHFAGTHPGWDIADAKVIREGE